MVPREMALEALNTIIQLYFEKTLEKKRAVDLQKKELWRLFLFFFIFLESPVPPLLGSNWASLPGPSHTLRLGGPNTALHQRMDSSTYQRRCHKLTLGPGLATERLRQLNEMCSEEELEIHYQEPPDAYLGKFKRNWAVHFAFLIFIYGFMVSSSLVILCF